jgi:hypothetical protein
MVARHWPQSHFLPMERRLRKNASAYILYLTEAQGSISLSAGPSTHEAAENKGFSDPGDVGAFLV